jgi:KDO2-lipid IV(A) lauroyltransferase
VHVGAHPLDSLPLLKHLRSGGVVAAQIDRSYPNQRSLDVEMFGRPFRIPEGPFVLSALVGAPVLPVFVRRVDYFDYEFSISPAIQLPRRAGPDHIQRAAEQATMEMERFIRAHPTQWFHFGGG